MKRVFPISLFLILLSPVLIFVNAADEEAIAKKKAADDYRTSIVATQITDPAQFGWTGNENKCKPGKVSHDTYVKMLTRINYYRRLAGLKGNIYLDSSWNKYAQAAALIMYANNTLDHSPNASMKCFSQEGKIGASTSNLSLFSGVSIQQLITDEVEDGNLDNKDCGHRRWILFSKAYKMGFGATPQSYALRDFASDEEEQKDTSSFHGTVPEYFAYPFRGYIPYETVFCKWSFAIPASDAGTADFA
ncbi:MAG TPA: CAP domain-containing protein, partial [Bacteroidia bacterium]|nr:CAP domain-containing protein [Bacteroidia bacterium]